MTTSRPLAKSSLEERASTPMSVTPRPFLRWAGSKRAHLRHLVNHIPSEYGTYWEPFLGSGALFFLLQPERAVLSDLCQPLISTFKAVRDGPKGILAHLSNLEVNEATYNRIRSQAPSGRFQRAAYFIYLNKTGWNGLYRVNSLGVFNVPYGMPKTPNIVDPTNLLECAHALGKGGVTVGTGDFEACLENVSRGDLVFLDPPYVTRHNNNGFVDYNEKLFSWADQTRLASVAHDAACRGATVIVTNAAHTDVTRLYRGFRSFPFQRSSTLASDTAKRGRVTETILVSR